MDDIHLLHQRTQQYGEAVKAFLVAVTASPEADQDPRIVDLAVILRDHFEWFHLELDRLWRQMQRSNP